MVLRVVFGIGCRQLRIAQKGCGRRFPSQKRKRLLLGGFPKNPWGLNTGLGFYVVVLCDKTKCDVRIDRLGI